MTAPRTGIEPISTGRQPARIPDAQRGFITRSSKTRHAVEESTAVENVRSGVDVSPRSWTFSTVATEREARSQPPAVGFGAQPAPSARRLAPEAGFEPAVCRLTAGRLSAWLPRNSVRRPVATPGARTKAFSIVKEHASYAGSGGGIRTPVDLSRVSCPSVGRLPNASKIARTNFQESKLRFQGALRRPPSTRLKAQWIRWASNPHASG